jgi:hypothetical protein
MIWPEPPRITATSLMATAVCASPQVTSSPGIATGVQRPVATSSSAHAIRSTLTDVRTPRLPQAVASTGRDVGAAACSALSTVPYPPNASSRSQAPAVTGSATWRVCPGAGTWPTISPCADAQAPSSPSAVSSARFWMDDDPDLPQGDVARPGPPAGPLD